MWLPRLMRAANEEQEHRAVGLSGRAAQNLFGTLVACECGHLAPYERATPVVCSRSEVQALKHRFTLVKWCCIIVLLLIFALIEKTLNILPDEVFPVFSGLLTSTSTELASGNFYLFVAIIFLSLIFFVALCFLRARTLCRRRDVYHCHRNHAHLRPFQLPAPFFTHGAHSLPHTHAPVSSIRCSQSPFCSAALLEACVAPLPSYNEAIKEPVFAPPAYSVIVAQPELVMAGCQLNGISHRQTINAAPSTANNEQIEGSSNRNSDQELLVHSQPQTAETVTAVEVHQSDKTKNEAMPTPDDKSSEY